jgi:L,D-transpeptidase YcbB
MESRHDRHRPAPRYSHGQEDPAAWIYLTAWMTRDQTVQFRSDIYAQDEQLLEAAAEQAAFFNQAAKHPLTVHLAQ